MAWRTSDHERIDGDSRVESAMQPFQHSWPGLQPGSPSKYIRACMRGGDPKVECNSPVTQIGEVAERALCPFRVTMGRVIPKTGQDDNESVEAYEGANAEQNERWEKP